MIISSMQFTSRQDVDAKKAEMNVAFEDAIEIAADEMAQMTYQRLVSLHAAVTFYLIETARPLPRMVRYRFFSILPSLAVAHKLYYDSSRADQLRVENKVVHPAFMRLIGRALSN
jgi:prophage DNA circulation protein